MLKVNVKMLDGTIYRNLYYEATWDELETTYDVFETMRFYVKKDGKFSPIELKSDDIDDVLECEELECDNFDLVTDCESGQTILSSAPGDEDVSLGFHPRLSEVYAYELMCYPEFLKNNHAFNSEESVYYAADNMAAVTNGYMEAAFNLDDRSLTADDIFVMGFKCTLLMLSYATDLMANGGVMRLLDESLVDLTMGYSRYADRNYQYIVVKDIERKK